MLPSKWKLGTVSPLLEHSCHWISSAELKCGNCWCVVSESLQWKLAAWTTAIPVQLASCIDISTGQKCTKYQGISKVRPHHKHHFDIIVLHLYAVGLGTVVAIYMQVKPPVSCFGGSVMWSSLWFWYSMLSTLLRCCIWHRVTLEWKMCIFGEQIEAWAYPKKEIQMMENHLAFAAIYIKQCLATST